MSGEDRKAVSRVFERVDKSPWAVQYAFTHVG